MKKPLKLNDTTINPAGGDQNAPERPPGLLPFIQSLQSESYRHGLGVAQNSIRAVECYRAAAAHGDPEAQQAIGECYYNGEGVNQDMGEAASWFRQSAEQGDPEGQFFLGMCYHGGDGVDQDDSKAVRWYRRAAHQGHAKAQSFLGLAYAIGIGGLVQDNKQALEWYHRAADQGDRFAEEALLPPVATQSVASAEQAPTVLPPGRFFGSSLVSTKRRKKEAINQKTDKSAPSRPLKNIEVIPPHRLYDNGFFDLFLTWVTYFLDAKENPYEQIIRTRQR